MSVNPTNRHIKPTAGEKHEREVSMKHQIPRYIKLGKYGGAVAAEETRTRKGPA
jgi:hypothetical protein